jgi:putative DNA primase/helicase
MAVGWAVFPVRDKKPLIKWKDGATRDWTSWPEGAQVGLPTGQRNGIVVIDDDRGKHGLVPWRCPVTTYRVNTPSGGRHYYFLHPGESVRNSAGKLAQHVDVRGDGGYVVFYGGDGTPFRPLPEGLIPPPGREKRPIYIPPADREGIQHLLERLPPWPQGERNHTLFRMACMFLENQMDIAVLYRKALQSGIHPDEAERTITSAQAKVVR